MTETKSTHESRVPLQTHTSAPHAPRSFNDSLKIRLDELPDNAVAKRLVFFAIVAGLLGLMYFFDDSRTPFEDVSPGSSLLTSPPAQLPRPGSYVASRILPNGDIQVEHWVRTRTPISEIRLVVPHSNDAGRAPRAINVRVADELGHESVATNVVRSTSYLLNYPSLVARLRYTLVGAVVRSWPSAPGRALARFTSARLVYAGSGDGPMVVQIRAPETLNVACRSSQETGLRPCGSQEGTSWRVELQGVDRADEVSAQVNLQSP